ncbi:MAG: Crp/Fnr family transcriptional regulator [Sulfurovum sp.]|nr:MAG: Crp/Fnr family transcriptional regulator [Sulfurovum sp.]
MSSLDLLPFQGMEPAVQGEINKATKVVTRKKGDAIFADDELTRYFYVVKSGKVKNYQLNLDNGKEQTLYIFREGDMFDTVTLLDGEPHDVMYEVIEACELLQFPIDFVRDLLKHPEFNKRFFPYIAKQMRHIEELATDMSLYSTAERLIKLIIQDRDPKSIFRFNILEGLSHSEVANLLGTVRHVVERHLKALKEDSLINVQNKRIEILNADRLLQKINLL